MRELTEEEKMELREVCARHKDHAAKLEAGGRWLASHWVLHWTGADIEKVIGSTQRKPRKR